MPYYYKIFIKGLFMTYFFQPLNPNTYTWSETDEELWEGIDSNETFESTLVTKYIESHEYIQWPWNNKRNIRAGDIILMYVSGNRQQVRYIMKIVKVNYVPDGNGFRTNALLRTQSVLSPEESNKLNLNSLRDNGLSGNIQSLRSIQGNLLDYVLTIIGK